MDMASGYFPLVIAVLLSTIRSLDLSFAFVPPSLINTLRLLHLRRKEFRLEKWVTPDGSRWQHRRIRGRQLGYISEMMHGNTLAHCNTRIHISMMERIISTGGNVSARWRYSDRWTHTEARVENHIRESSLAKISDVRAKELVSQKLDKISLL